MGAEGFHGRVRDGIGCWAPRYGHQAGQAPGDGWGEGEVSGGVRWGWAQTAFAAAPICGHHRGPLLVVMRSR